MIFAHIENNEVTNKILVDDQSFIDTLPNSNEFIRVSEDNGEDGFPVLEIGFSYNDDLGKYIAPKPFDSWVLNSETGFWEPPTSFPDDGKFYIWDEETISWIHPKPFDSWVLNSETGFWEPPVAMPNDGQSYMWNEETLSWNVFDENDTTGNAE
jgi:hypothetical protein